MQSPSVTVTCPPDTCPEIKNKERLHSMFWLAKLVLLDNYLVTSSVMKRHFGNKRSCNHSKPSSDHCHTTSNQKPEYTKGLIAHLTLLLAISLKAVTF